MREESSLPTKQRHFLAFDFGMKRIGSAVGQLITQSASPLTTINAKDGIPEWFVLDDLITTWRPAALIVGVPLNMDGSAQQLTYCAKKFCNRLRNRYPLTVYEVDERLTTREAKNRVFAASGSRKALSKVALDNIAAQIIFETWLSQSLPDEMPR